MKIIHVIPSISRESSGPSYSVRKLTEYLIDLKCPVMLAAINWGNNKKINEPNFYFFKLFPFIKKLGISFELKSWLFKQGKISKDLILHNHGMWQMNAVYAAIVSKQTGAHLISSPRGSLSSWAFNSGSRFKKLFWVLFQERALKNSKVLHATSIGEYEDIRAMGFKQPVAIIPNGIDLHPQLKNIHRKKTVLYLGRIHPVKGIDILLESWRAVESIYPDWELKIVGGDYDYHGSNGHEKKLKELVRKLKLCNVNFSQAIYGADKFSVYKESSIYVLPSHSENFGITVVEALASGTPVITTKNTPWEELEKYDAGKCVELNKDTLSKAIIDLISVGEKSRQIMGENGKLLVREKYNWNSIAENFLELYKWTLGKVSTVPDFVKIN